MGGVEQITSFIQSKAFSDDPSALVFTLHEHTGSLLQFSDVVFAVCQQFIGPLSDATRDPARGAMHDLSMMLPTLIRLYEEANEKRDMRVANKCLDILDTIYERRLGIVTEIAEAVG